MFHMLLLEHNSTKKAHKFSVLEFELGDNKKYKIEAIQDSTVYAKETNGHLPKSYYLVV